MKKIKKILIVDDEPDVLEFLSYNFKKNDYKVSVAASGKEGIETADSEDPDLIISDIMMPDVDGIEMCKRIREHVKFKNTPFIFLTAVNDDYKVLYAMGAGADQIASKPVRFEYLLEMVKHLINKNE
jgi:two-component system, OmpR family, alkaline phosphatase synthesis response regulator PhoP